jgi:hypothetical protein
MLLGQRARCRTSDPPRRQSARYPRSFPGDGALLPSTGPHPGPNRYTRPTRPYAEGIRTLPSGRSGILPGSGAGTQRRGHSPPIGAFAETDWAQAEAIAAYRDAERLLTDSSAPAAELSALGIEATATAQSPEEVCEAQIRNGDRLRNAGDYARAAEATRQPSRLRQPATTSASSTAIC